MSLPYIVTGIIDNNKNDVCIRLERVLFRFIVHEVPLTCLLVFINLYVSYYKLKAFLFKTNILTKNFLFMLRREDQTDICYA